jgi:hypothetical protein
MSSVPVYQRVVATAVAVLLFAALTVSPAAAVDPPVEIVIDFETLPDGSPVAEGDAITDQYAALGVTFSLVGSDDAPVIAIEGGTATTAFVGPETNDAPTSPGGIASLTSGASSASQCPCLTSIQIDFDPPVTSVSIQNLNMDGSDSVFLKAFDVDGNLVTFNAAAGLGFPEGDGAIVVASVSAVDDVGITA